MAIDVPRFMRLRSSIDATIGASEHARRGLRGIADTFREQIREMLAGEPSLLGEFDGLFPASAIRSDEGSLYSAAADPYSPARLVLAGMSGWLGGLVEAAQVAAQRQANADAYAAEKVRSERGVGFRSEQ